MVRASASMELPQKMGSIWNWENQHVLLSGNIFEDKKKNNKFQYTKHHLTK